MHMTNKKWIAPILPYLAVWAGLFLFKSAWFALIGFHVAILLVLAVVRPNIPINILFKSKYPKWILISVLFCSTSGIGLYFLWDLFGIAPDLPAQLQSIGLEFTSFVVCIHRIFFPGQSICRGIFLARSSWEQFKKTLYWRCYLCGLSCVGFMGQGASIVHSICRYYPHFGRLVLAANLARR